MNGTSDYLI